MARGEKRELVYDSGWNQMYDADTPQPRRKRALKLLRNMYPDRRGMVKHRPGFSLPVSRTGKTQLIADYTKKDGTHFTILVIGGKFYTWDFVGASVEIVTTAELTAAAVTLSTTATCYALQFADKIVISDGVNTPFTWDGTAHAGIVKLTNCPVLYGQPTEYYGRMFGIKATDRTTIVWSEVLQPNVGYEAGFANAWTVTQTDPDVINAIFGTNDAIYVFRSRSTTALIGRPDTNFSSSGTKEGVDEGIGTSSPSAIVSTSRALFFLDSDFRARLLRPGGALVPAWEGFAQTITGLNRAALPSAIGVYWSDPELILFTIPLVGGTSASRMLVYDAAPEIPVPIAVWDFDTPPTISALALLPDASGVPTLLHGTTTGNVYQWSPINALSSNDGSGSDNGTLVHQEIRTQCLSFDTEKEWIFDELAITFVPYDRTAVYVGYETSRGRGPTQKLHVDGGPMRWGLSKWSPIGAGAWAAPGSGVVKKSLGLNARGRWIRIFIWHSPDLGDVPFLPEDLGPPDYLTNYFAFSGLRLSCYASDDAPDVP